MSVASHDQPDTRCAGPGNAMNATRWDALAAALAPQLSPTAKLSREVQARLGQQLRSLYDDVVNQGVPDRFTDLINQINVNGNKDGQ